MSSGPIQRLTRVLVALVAVCVLGLVAGIVLVSIENAQTNRRLDALEEYVQGKGEARDRENDQLREQQRQGMCELLDTFPAGLPSLERPRAKYHCGPGIPLDQLTPQEQARIAGSNPAVVPPPDDSPQPPPPPLGSAAVPDPPRSPANAPTPAPHPPPVDVGPITDLTCALAGVCPKENP